MWRNPSGEAPLKAIKQTMKNQRGMTLIEIMVVIAIIGILSTAIGFGVVNYMKKAKVDTTALQLKGVASALNIYAIDNDWPQDIRDLLEVSPPLIKEKQLMDPWKNEIVYRYPGSGDNEYDLCSAGPDKSEGTEDDICHD
jgi:general secretion pathway protein G